MPHSFDTLWLANEAPFPPLITILTILQAINSYMWFLMIAFIPAYPPTAEDTAPAEGGKDDFYSMGKADTAEAETQVS